MVVTALDIGSQVERDNFRLGELNKQSIGDISRKTNFNDAFSIAKHVLGSNIEKVQMNIYDVGKKAGVYDVVFCNDVLLHLSDPFRALSSMREACKKYLIVGTCMYMPHGLLAKIGALCLRACPIAEFLGARPKHAFWMPNMKCFQELVVGAGFNIVKASLLKPDRAHAEYAGLRGMIVATCS